MPTQEIIFIHGFASSANSAKAAFLRERFATMPGAGLHAPDFNPSAMDFEFLTVTGTINRLRQFILDRGLEDVGLIGSSLGGLVALHYARFFGGVNRLLLLAPVLSYRALPIGEESLRQWQHDGATEVFHYGHDERLPLRYDFHLDGLRYGDEIPPPAEVRIVHGSRDETIPVVLSRAYASRNDSATLREVDSDHSLHDRFGEIWEEVVSFLLRGTGTLPGDNRAKV